ncbi:SSU ribosomal protein S1P [Neorhodopirellula lusitana]|uniref:SSU ribosomal protein S1P n=1 Tax=Neorhodopirellula lusitana TaxID=445327 RepID=A0ABY1QH35_9BACT|nr:S1 RNA-binding domain-containing protein [Neorhodopirellula lusitana]SMP71408.1 SSU ribosomal protein S1P [Neorhodopirellula lusitana]
MSVTENSETNPPATAVEGAAETPSSENAAANVAPAIAASTTSEAGTGEPVASDAAASDSATPAAKPAKKKGAPLPRIGGGPLSARGLGVAKPISPSAVSTEDLERQSQAKPDKKQGGGKKGAPRPRLAGESDQDVVQAQKTQSPKPGKIAVPNVRDGLSDDLEAELQASLAGSELDSFLGGSAGLPDRREPLAEGARVHAKVLKIHEDTVFVSLGGPDEGTVPFEQFTDAEPVPGEDVEVIVRGLNREDGLYSCSRPGSAIAVSDWDDIDEGSVVEATVTGHNTGGLECTVGSVKGFMPISQVTEYRVEDLSEFVDQKFVCLVTEANAQRGNLVLSRRAILEREREVKRKEQLEKIEPGDILEGVVRSVRDFGAFVDLGGLDGLIHVSKLSWERVKHPSEVIEEGQMVKVRVDKVDKQTGKIGLTYRDLLENPWDSAEAEFSVGSLHNGTVTRTAEFGCFVRLTAGVEGLVHISELASHRVSKVDAFVNVGDEVHVKVLSFDRDAQKVGLSIKGALAKPSDSAKVVADEPDEPPREPEIGPQHDGPLRGGNDRPSGGERFGLRW